jgi:superfamily I DNA and/or RNA helicase
MNLFYDGDLIPSADQFKVNSLVNWEHLPQKGFPVVFHGVKGSDEREGNSPSWFNPEEVQIVKEYVGLLVRGTRSNRVKPEEIAVITPYQKQAQKIRMLLKSHDYGDIKVGSVDEFQGSERRVVIISTVRSTKEYLDFDAKHQLGFLSNPKRFNVAITRAQALLIVIGNPVVLEEDNNWSSFVRYCFTNKGYTGVDFKPDTNRKKEYDAGIDGAISGIVNMSLHSKVDDSDDTDDFVMVSNTTAQEGPAWRMEE